MNLKVESIMAQDVVALQPTDLVPTAIEIMRKKHFRHIPIVSKKGDFLGLISHRDLLAASASFLTENYAEDRKHIFRETRLNKIMRRRIRTTTPKADLREVARIMRKNKLGCLPVLRRQRLVGIITESDFLGLSINLLSLHEQVQKTLDTTNLGSRKG